MKEYAIKDPKGEIIPWTCNEKELSARVEAVHSKHYEFTWEEMEKLGYRCVPVEITEIKTEKV